MDQGDNAANSNDDFENCKNQSARFLSRLCEPLKRAGKPVSRYVVGGPPGI